MESWTVLLALMSSESMLKPHAARTSAPTAAFGVTASSREEPSSRTAPSRRLRTGLGLLACQSAPIMAPAPKAAFRRPKPASRTSKTARAKYGMMTLKLMMVTESPPT